MKRRPKDVNIFNYTQLEDGGKKKPFSREATKPTSDNLNNSNLIKKVTASKAMSDKKADENQLNKVAFNDAKAWMMEYMGSPKYIERLKNFYDNPESVQKSRINRTSRTDQSDNLLGKAMAKVNDFVAANSPMQNTIFTNKDGMDQTLIGFNKDEKKLVRGSVYAHELSHTSNALPFTNNTLNGKEKELIRSKNKLVNAKDLEITDFNRSHIKHEKLPQENKSDIDAFRYLLKKRGIYDAGKQEFNKDFLQKAYEDKVIWRQEPFERLKANFSNEDIIELMNKVASNNGKSSATAKYGSKLADGGMAGDPPVRRRRGNTDDAPKPVIENTPQGYQIPEVEVTAQAPAWKKYDDRFEKQFPKSQRINQYLNPMARSLGNSETNYPERIDTQYQKDKTDYTARALILDRSSDKYTDKERDILHNSQYNNMSKEDVYKNPQHLPIASSNPYTNFLYDNQYLTKIPGVRQGIQYLANKTIDRGTVARGFQDTQTPTSGTDSDKAYNDAPRFNPLSQFLGGDQGATKSKYAPKSDYMKFLPSYSLKDKLGVSQRFQDYTSQYTGDVINELKKKPIYDSGLNDSPYADAPDLGHYKSGAAWDAEKNLPYYFVSDAWDFDPQDYATRYQNSNDKAKPQESYVQASLMQSVGDPYKIYDRFYFDPKTGEYIDDNKQNIDNNMKQTTKKYGGKMPPAYEQGGFVNGNMFYNDLPNYIHNYNGINGIPPKVYENGGNTGSGSYFAPYPFNMGISESGYGHLPPPKVYANGGIVPTSRSFAGSPFPRDYRYETYPSESEYPYNEQVPTAYLTAESGIHINPANKGKFNATKKKTGKSTEELTHSKNPKTRKRAIFAQNAAKWNHADNGGGPYGDIDRVGNLPMYAPISNQLENPIPTGVSADGPTMNEPQQGNSFGSVMQGIGSGIGSMHLNTGAGIAGLGMLSNSVTANQDAARESATSTRRNITQGREYNPYKYGTGSSALFANGGNIQQDPVQAALQTLRDAGYDIQMD